jgi:hypothetical protein
MNMLKSMMQLIAASQQIYERTIGSLASAGAGLNPEDVLYCIVCKLGPTPLA